MKKKLSELKQSDVLLDLRPVNPVVVSRYRQAMRHGAVFPPMKYDVKHNILVGGNHRYAAYMEEFGENHEVEVEKLTCKEWGDVLETFAVDNAQHGMPLEGFHRRRVALALIDAGRTIEQVARLFDVSVGRLEHWGAQTVRIIGQAQPGPVKYGVPTEPKAIGKREYASHVKVDKGVSVRSMAKQITDYIRRGWIQLEDDRETEALAELKEALDGLKL